MVIQSGVFTERLFARILTGLGYSNLAATYDVETLRAILAERDPYRLSWLDANYSEDTSPERIVDYAFGIDYLIEVAPTNQRIGMDFTINGSSLHRKMQKLDRNKWLWHGLGISTNIVVCFELPNGHDQGLLFYDLEDCEDKLLDGIFSAIESKKEVTAINI